MMTRIAIIDMGTNTFHLLLAEVGPEGYRVTRRHYEAVKIGMAGINEGFITESGCARAIEAMKKFRTIIDEHKIARVHAFGTSAFRHAKNALALAAEIKSATGISITVLSGEEEADYIFAGVKSALDLGEKANLVVDIGAGSVEFIIGDRRQIAWKKSFEIGGQRLLEQFQKHDPILSEEIDVLDVYFERTLSPLLDVLKKFQPEIMVGSSGSFDTLSDIFCVRRAIPRKTGATEIPLSLEGFYEIYHELIHRNRSERMQMEGMIDLRVDMIVVGCCLIRFLLDRHPFTDIRVSTFSLKEGVLATLAQ